MRLVTVGRTQGGEAVIAKGLTAGEIVVREGQFLLGPGSRVEVKDLAKSGEAKEEGASERPKRGRGKEKAKAETRGAS
jgi:hypothetical protein